MKIFSIYLLIPLLLFAQEMRIDYADVVISINAKQKKLLKNTQHQLNEGDSVRFVSGEGKVVIGMVQLIKNNDSYQVPLSKSFSVANYIKEKKQSFLALFDKSTPKEQDGIAIKGVLPKIEKVIDLKDQKSITIVNDHFSPYPITLFIKNENDETIERLISKDKKITFFKIDTSMLKDGYSLLIINANGDHLALYEIFKG